MPECGSSAWIIKYFYGNQPLENNLTQCFYFAFWISLLTLIGGLLAANTKLVNYVHFHWSLMAIVLSIIFLSVHSLLSWFFRDRKVFKKEASNEFATAIWDHHFCVDPFIVIDSLHPAAETSIGDGRFLFKQWITCIFSHAVVELQLLAYPVRKLADVRTRVFCVIYFGTMTRVEAAKQTNAASTTLS